MKMEEGFVVKERIFFKALKEVGHIMTQFSVKHIYPVLWIRFLQPCLFVCLVSCYIAKKIQVFAKLQVCLESTFSFF